MTFYIAPFPHPWKSVHNPWLNSSIWHILYSLFLARWTPPLSVVSVFSVVNFPHPWLNSSIWHIMCFLFPHDAPPKQWTQNLVDSRPLYPQLDAGWQGSNPLQPVAEKGNLRTDTTYLEVFKNKRYINSAQSLFFFVCEPVKWKLKIMFDKFIIFIHW